MTTRCSCGQPAAPVDFFDVFDVPPPPAPLPTKAYCLFCAVEQRQVIRDRRAEADGKPRKKARKS
jgi:hypothetical protein